jgi:hypothetical protein
MAMTWVLLQKRQGGLLNLPKKILIGQRYMVLKLNHG